MYLNSKTILFVLAVIVLSACDRTATPNLANFTPPNIDLPFNEEVIQYDDFTIKPSEGGSFETERGTKVSFPADAFVFEDGSKVTEPVQIQFREYHTASEILMSGIRMTAENSTGEVLPFESAGMFDINGKCGDKKVKIAEGKTAQIILPNKKTDTDFNFYRLDEKGGWVELQQNLKVEPNPIPEDIKIAAEKADPVKPLEPEKFDNNAFVFDLDMDTERYPELKELYGIMWQYAGEKGSDTDPEKNKKITETAWTGSEIIRSGEDKYTLVFKNKKETLQIPVKPVLSGKNYAEAKKRYDDKMNSYKGAVAAKEAAVTIMNARSEYARQLAISGFGIYNCDRFYMMPQAKTVQAPMFTVNKKQLPAGTTLFHIAKEDIVIQVYDQSQPFKYGRREKNRIIAVMPDKTVAAMSEAEFTAAVETGGDNVMFNLKQLPLGKITPEELSKVISTI